MMFIVNANNQNPASGEKWAAYKGVYAAGDKVWPDWWGERKFQANDGGLNQYQNRYGYQMRCYGSRASSGGYKMTAGNINVQNKLCNTNM